MKDYLEEVEKAPVSASDGVDWGCLHGTAGFTMSAPTFLAWYVATQGYQDLVF